MVHLNILPRNVLLFAIFLLFVERVARHRATTLRLLIRLSIIFLIDILTCRTYSIRLGAWRAVLCCLDRTCGTRNGRFAKAFSLTLSALCEVSLDSCNLLDLGQKAIQCYLSDCMNVLIRIGEKSQ